MLRVSDIAESLLQELINDPPEPNAPVKSSREIAARFRVSLLTADRAIKKLVEHGVFYRVGRKGTFFRQLPPDGIKKPLIGFAACFQGDMQHRNEMNRENLALLRKNYRVRIIMHHELKDPIISSKELAGLDALVLTSDLIDDEIRRNLARFNKPIVSMYLEFAADANINQVILDFSEAFNKAVSLIQNCRNRRFILIAEMHSNGRFRLENFKNALRHAGVPEKNIAVIKLPHCSHSTFSPAEVIEKLLPQLNGKFIFCTSDIISEMLLKALNASDLTPGKDFEFLGCDNLAAADIGLSTVDCHFSKIPETVCKLLDTCLRARDNFKYTIAIPATLVIRETALAYAEEENKLAECQIHG
ncbi:MAG: substrate-binding domain-containing protein [Lentisphaeria bacterium]|nr:substrate-binding domain-containing protein [Lentisphaeria bacterium]